MRLYSVRATEVVATRKLATGQVTEAIALLRSLTDEEDHRQLLFPARARLAHALVAKGDLKGALITANAALEESVRFPSAQAAALGALAVIALGAGNASEALGFAERGLFVEPRGCWPSDGSLLRLVRAQALHGLGRMSEALAAIRNARNRILEISRTLDDPDLQASYVTNVEANSRTLSLARVWLGN